MCERLIAFLVVFGFEIFSAREAASADEVNDEYERVEETVNDAFELETIKTFN